MRQRVQRQAQERLEEKRKDKLEEARERQTDLKNQIDQLRNRLNESRKAIGLEEEHLRDAISCAGFFF